MGYETSKFGDGGYTSGTTNVIGNVSNFYGPRDHDVTAGVIKTEGGQNELTIVLDAVTLTDGDLILTAKPFIPAGSRVLRAYVQVEEAFAITGTTPLLSVGTEGAAAANGLDITEAQLEAIGVYDITSTLAGTWHPTTGTGIVDRTVVGLAESAGFTVTGGAGGVGKATVVVTYIHV